MVSQLQRIAAELLRAKGDLRPVGTNWSQKYLSRYPLLQSRFVPLLDKSRVIVEDPDQIMRFFELFRTTKEEYSIHNNDVYNIDKKGIMIGVLVKLKIICLRKHKKTRTTQQGKREQVSLIKCISSDRRVLTLYVIFKAKVLLKDQYNEFRKDRGGTCAVLDRGQTNNKLCLKWFKIVFKPETLRVKKGEY